MSRAGINDTIRQLQKIQALMIAVQDAANHDVEFDVSDAMAAILGLLDQTLTDLDLLESKS